MTPELRKIIAGCYHTQKGVLDANKELLDIQEGNLLPYVEREMAAQLSLNAFNMAKKRIPPINVQRRVIDKLSMIYAKPPTRELGESATDKDKELWGWYVDNMKVDVVGQTMNEYFNLLKASAWEPYLDEQYSPRLRAIPRDRFFVLGMNPVDPLQVTHFVKLMGFYAKDKKNETGELTGTSEDKCILFVYTDLEFEIIDEDGDLVEHLMAKMKEKYGTDGTNPYGAIPFIYANRSKVKINPEQDSDMYRMTTLIPVLFGDVNYALMFQAFSIFWGINIDQDTLKLNPNSFINLKTSGENPGAKPELHTIKPEVDSEKAIQAIMDQLGLWLQSKGIRPGTVGKASADMTLSGISKMIDEMDTSGDRQKQIPVFVDAEENLFKLVAYKMHPVWMKNPNYKNKFQFSSELEYRVLFPEQVVWQTRAEILDETKKEMDMRLLSRESAIQRINPNAKPEELQEELSKVKDEDAEKAEAEAKKNPPPNFK